jgi:mitogen-activated protein kinase kinase
MSLLREKRASSISSLPRLHSVNSVGSLANLSIQKISLDLPKNTKYKFRADDINVLNSLGSGISGRVHKVIHKPSNLIAARKLIYFSGEEEYETNLLRELKILKNCCSPFSFRYF